MKLPHEKDPPEQQTSGFEGALGLKRGSDRADELKPMVTPRQRVRRFFTWFNEDRGDVNRLNRLIDEIQKADELGLFASHGRWQDLDDGPDPLVLTFLTDIDTGEALAIIEMSDPGNGTLYLPDDYSRRRP